MKPTRLDLAEDGFTITWEDGSESFHPIYEPMQHFIYEDLIILLGHEELVIVKDKEQVFHGFTR